jgi:hypothetical protein
MNTSNQVLSMRSVSDTADSASLSFARKEGICAAALIEARRLADDGRFGATFSQLLERARDLLEELDELVVALRSAGRRREDSAAAALHRQLESLQALMDARRPDGESMHHAARR